MAKEKAEKEETPKEEKEKKGFVILLKEGLEYDVQEKDVEALLSQGFSKK